MAARNGWSAYQKLVLSELEDHSRGLSELAGELKQLRTKDITDIKVEIAMLKIKAGLWGAGAGAIPGLIAAFGIWIYNG